MEKARPALFPTLTLTLTALTLAAVPAHLGGDDSREGALSPSNVELSPDGRWVAMTCTGESGEQGIWLVDLADAGPPRAVEGPFPPQPEVLAWSDDGQLGIEFAARRTGRHWVDPESGEVLWIDPYERRDDELEGGWARVEVRKKSSGNIVRAIRWVERDETFELVGRVDREVQLSSEPGMVFHATRERGVLRIFRHDMHRDVTDLVHEIESGSPWWSVSPDGTSIAARDDTRLRVVDAADGETLAGPWVDAHLSWLEDDGSRFARLGAGGHRYLLDLWSGRQVHLGEADGRAFELHVLADGRFVLHSLDERRLDLMDPDGALLRNLVPGERVVETASR